MVREGEDMLHQEIATAPRKLAGTPMRRADETYRHFRLVAAQTGIDHIAIAYAGKSAMFQLCAPDLDTAMVNLRDAIDRDLDRREEARAGEKPDIHDLQLALELIDAHMTPASSHIIARVVAASWPAGPSDILLRCTFAEDALLRGLVRLARQIADALGIKLPKHPQNAVAALALIIDDVPEPFGLKGPWHFRKDFMVAARHYLTS
jgi:hypothetical protein